MKVREKEKKNPELLVNCLFFFLPVIEIKIRIYPFMECYSL